MRLRSPIIYADVDDVAWLVTPSGVVVYNVDYVTDFYGRISPYTTFSATYAVYVRPDGDVYSFNTNVYNSYGINHSIVLYGNFRAN